MSHAAPIDETRTPPQQRSSLLWVALGVLAAAQLFAFWLVCSQQVRKAEARHEEAVVQQMALADCLQYIPASTIASCSARNRHDAGVSPADAATDTAALTATVPVSFSFR
jgi:bacteriorhodopsin